MLPAKRQDPDDPLTRALAPPPDESPHARAAREAMEQEALRVSNAIDDALKAERLAEKKKRMVKLLLLGQSESGKSTTLRQFQLHYTPQAFREEKILWRAVIQLNLVRSILTVLEALKDAQSESLARPVEPADDSSDDDPLFFSDDFEIIKARLDPLRHVEEILIAKVAPGDENDAPVDEQALYNGGGIHPPKQAHGKKRQQEVAVSSSVVALLKGRGAPGRPRTSHDAQSFEEWDEATEVICHCREEMMALWEDPTVREVLKRRKVRVEESPGFFLDDLERITSPQYLPSDDDVLRARLKTVGVTEYRFDMEASAGRESGSEWRIYDVGGSRSQVPMWVPFFDDVDAIIFLAPISAFDQALVEDHSINRLEDSVLIWKSICSNPLLAKVDLILFLNKCDMLARKLETGVRLSKYVRSFGERSNDVDTASQYFKSKFQAIQREYSPQPRRFYGYATSVTDRETTKGILSSVRDMIIREHLRKSRLI
ncbi:guanine nucleotide binding protein, alpha subunit [Gautieria morchelliformis]|nr:guanine nucleotide binding protein, alpha subunit [Gautieria morchelliformis]